MKTHSSGKKNRFGWAAAVCLCLAVAAALTAFHLMESRQSPSEKTPATAVTEGRTHRENLETFLIFGLDKFEAEEDAMGYLNDQQSDFLMLVVLDRDSKVCNLLHLNRDTMTEIRRLGIGGGSAGKFEGQLALAHTYGSGGSDSSLNTVKAVSTFLGGEPIDHYIGMTMDMVGRLNDLVGGVTVTIMDDMTSVDPSFVKGDTVTLHGDQALLYVRTRFGLNDSTNLRRMERQRQYLEALYHRLLLSADSETSQSHVQLLELLTSLQTDLSVNQLDGLRNTLKEYQVAPILYIEGEAVKGEKFMEFYPDEASRQSVIETVFYE